MSWKQIAFHLITGAVAFVFIVVMVGSVLDTDSSEPENSFKSAACHVYTQTRSAETALFAAGFTRSADYEQQMATAHAALTHLEAAYTDSEQLPTILNLHIYQDQIGVAYDATKDDKHGTDEAKHANAASDAIQAAASVRIRVNTFLGCTPLELEEDNPRVAAPAQSRRVIARGHWTKRPA